ncbi:MAG: radical SAM protein [Candidatus Marsarchaeota archaeon]
MQTQEQGVKRDQDQLFAVYHRTREELDKMPVIGKTKTVCPVCKRIIDGVIYKDGDYVMIRKECPEHGLFIEKYWEDYELYKKMSELQYNGRGLENPNYIPDTTGANCPFDCGLCQRHLSHTGLANVVVTNRCHLNCWYCFFYAKEGEPIYEPTLDEFKKLFANLRAQRPIPPNAIQLTGGEPTLHPQIVEIVKAAREAGFEQVQLNTTGINLGLNPDLAVRLRYAGVNTLYLSFDGVSMHANPKNHWEIPYILDASRRAELGIVLVPTVIRGINDKELGAMVNFALNNIDVVRSVNFQPVSLVGRMPDKARESMRITIPGMIKELEEQTHGVINRDDWYSVPYTGVFDKFLEAVTGRYMYDMSIHFACGMGTYLFLDDDKRIIPIPEFVDVIGLNEYLGEKYEEIKNEKGISKKMKAARILLDVRKFVDEKKQPKSVNFLKLLTNLLVYKSFDSLGALHHNTLFLGAMHFQDEYNYDIERVERCDIHYAMPDGEVLPFCTFNVFPEIYRDKIQRQYSIPAEIWKKEHPDWDYASDKYKRDVKKLQGGELYRKTYGGIVDYFALPVNGGKPVPFAKPDLPDISEASKSSEEFGVRVRVG